jgi:AraC-like DNA-binding protein
MSRRIPKEWCEDYFRTIDAGINAKFIHVWTFNPSFPVDVRFLTSGPGPTVRMKRHDYFEVLVLLSGAAELRIQDRSLPFNRGDAAIVGSTVYHSLEPQARSRFAVAALFFLPELIRVDYSPDSVGYLTPFLRQDAQFPHVIAAKTGIPGQILDLMQRIRALMPPASTLARLAATTYLELILLSLAQEYSCYEGSARTFESRQKALTRLQPLFTYVESYFEGEIRVETAARVCGMSKSYFINYFKNTTGQSFVSYLNHYRVQRAQQLLASTDRSLTDIGLEVGFCDQSYFGMIFRRLAGMTPSSYRKQFHEDAASPSSPNSLINRVPVPNTRLQVFRIPTRTKFSGHSTLGACPVQ